MSKSLGVIWNCDHVLKWNAKFGKIYEFKKIHSLQKWLIKNMWHIGAIVNVINNKLQKISFENFFLWKICFLTKGPQKDNNA